MPPFEECSLRPIREGDLDVVLEWRNSERIRLQMYTDHRISPEEHRRWFERVRKAEDAACCVMEVRGRPVGVVTVSRIDRRNGVCHWGFYVGDAEAPRGTGAALGFLGLEALFEAMSFRKVCGEVLGSNAASRRFHARYGFVEEGRFVRHVLKEGRYEDVIALALFKEEWFASKASLAEKCFSGEET